MGGKLWSDENYNLQGNESEEYIYISCKEHKTIHLLRLEGDPCERAQLLPQVLRTKRPEPAHTSAGSSGMDLQQQDNYAQQVSHVAS